MKLFKSLCFVALSALSLSASAAVDGFQSYKFGMDIKTIKQQKMCALEKVNEDEYYCNNLSLGKIKTDAFLYFVSGKFERIAISIPIDAVEGIVQALSSKYKLSTELPDEALSPKPNQIYDMGFDNDTILLRLGYENDMTESVWLIYTTPDFNQKLSREQANEVKDAL